MDLTVPRDRVGTFEPMVVKKHQKNVTGIEDQILSLYAKGVSTREIQDQLQNLYGIDVSPTLISNVTAKIMPMVKEWQNRPLQGVYAIVFLDAIHFKVRQDGMIQNKAAYMAIGAGEGRFFRRSACALCAFSDRRRQGFRRKSDNSEAPSPK